MSNKKRPRLPGSSLEDLLIEQDIFDDCRQVSIKRVLSYQIRQAMQQQNLSKSALASRMGTSRSALDRLLDPTNESVTLATLINVAESTNQQLRVQLVPDEAKVKDMS